MSPALPPTDAPPVESHTDEAETPDQAGRIVELDIDQIELFGDNHREPGLADKAALESLAQSIADHGLRQPVLVSFITDAKRPRYLLVYGHRRLAAKRQLGHTTIRAEVRDNLTPNEILTLRAIENLQRQDLNVMEQCVAVAQLIHQNGGSVDKAAADLGQERAWVQERWWIHERVSKQTKALALRGRLKIGHLRQLIKIGDKALQDNVARWGVSENTNGQAGHVSVQSVDWYKRQVEDHQRALRAVRWALDQPFARKPACVGCGHNSATDTQLFETGEADDGRCLNRACFDAKQKAADKAVQVTIDKLKKKKAEPTAAAVDQAKPAWLKRGPAQREAKKELGTGKRETSPSSGVATPGSTRASGGRLKRSPLGDAVKKYQDAVNVWFRAAGEQMDAHLKDHPALELAECFISELWNRVPWEAWDAGEYEREYWAPGRKAKAPHPEPPVPKKVQGEIFARLQAIRLIAPGDIPAPLRSLAMMNLGDRRDDDGILPSSYGTPPRWAMAAAEAAGLALDAPPVWADYAPKSNAAKPARKGKAVLKKTTKKTTKKKSKKKAGAKR